MLPDPLHPALVHFPVALAALVPAAAFAALVAIRLGWIQSRFWLVVVLLQAMLAGSAWVAVQTGEAQEERVERVVSKDVIEEHEEAAERLLLLTGIAFAASAAGLLAGRAGQIGQIATLVVGVAVMGSSVLVGRSGGALVYEHGAANAYLERSAPAPGGAEHGVE